MKKNKNVLLLFIVCVFSFFMCMNNVYADNTCTCSGYCANTYSWCYEVIDHLFITRYEVSKTKIGFWTKTLYHMGNIDYFEQDLEVCAKKLEGYTVKKVGNRRYLEYVETNINDSFSASSESDCKILCKSRHDDNNCSITVTYNGVSSTMESLSCNSNSVLSVVKIAAHLISIIKILIPAIIIVKATMLLSKSIVSEEDIGKKQIIEILKKFIIAAFVFFIPSIIFAIFELVQYYNPSEINFENCISCLRNPDTCNSLMSDTPGTCEVECSKSLFGCVDNDRHLAYYLNHAFNILKYAGVILCVVLSVVDFAKAVLSDDKDDLKNVVNRTLKRITYAVIIFFLPVVLKTVLEMINVYASCGI